jgi:cytochrome c2
MIPGNRMPFDGLSRPADRRALIIYMKTIVSEKN